MLQPLLSPDLFDGYFVRPEGSSSSTVPAPPTFSSGLEEENRHSFLSTFQPYPAEYCLVENITLVPTGRSESFEFVPPIRLFVVDRLDQSQRLFHRLGTQHLTQNPCKVSYLVEGGAQLFLLKNSRLEYQRILLSYETQGNSGAGFSSTISDLSEQLFEDTPVFLQDICKDRRSVGMVERYVDSGGQILVQELRVRWMIKPESLPQNSVESLVFERR